MGLHALGSLTDSRNRGVRERDVVRIVYDDRVTLVLQRADGVLGVGVSGGG